jgi:hypothetical protein
MQKIFSSHEYILCYKNQTNKNTRLTKISNKSTYKNLDNDPRGVWASDNLLRTEVRDYAVLVSIPRGWNIILPLVVVGDLTRIKLKS